MTFQGFPREAFDFYARLERDNSKPFWVANKAVYADSVVEPLARLSDDVAKKYSVLKLFRPYRDVRFSKDKTPYKTVAGAVGESDGGSAFYVQLQAEGLFVGCGMYMMAADQLERWRRSVDDDRLGASIVKVVESLRSAGYDIGAMDALKTAPRGFPKDHARIELLRMKGLTMGKQFPLAAWMHTPKAIDRITQVWDEAKAMNAWLGRNVGPSSIAPSEPD